MSSRVASLGIDALVAVAIPTVVIIVYHLLEYGVAYPPNSDLRFYLLFTLMLSVLHFGIIRNRRKNS